MNEKEIAELRRRFRADKSSISRVRGCYVNEKREIISQFDQSLGILARRRVNSYSPRCAIPSPAPWAKICWTSPLTPARWWRAISTSCS